MQTMYEDVGFVLGGLPGRGLPRSVACSAARRRVEVVRCTGGGGQVRARQHVNPLSRHLQEQIKLGESWPESAYEDLSRALHVDVGVAKGRFIMEMAELNKDTNFLGLEIREPLVDQVGTASEQPAGSPDTQEAGG